MKALFPKLHWFLLLLLPFTFFGFYPTYFSKLAETLTLFHVHAFLMLAWIALAIVQPWLILRKKTRQHKLVGRVSYLVMPLVFVTTYLVIRHIYFEQLRFVTESAARISLSFDPEQIHAKAAAHVALGSLYFIWLLTFYCLGILHRRRPLAHATYMFGAMLTLLGPTVDRLIYNVLSALHLPYTFLAENAVFISIILIVVGLIVYQKRKGYSIAPAGISLCIYLTGLLGFFTLPNTKIWTVLVETLM